jgi:hypothetical protein
MTSTVGFTRTKFHNFGKYFVGATTFSIRTVRIMTVLLFCYAETITLIVIIFS